MAHFMLYKIEDVGFHINKEYDYESFQQKDLVINISNQLQINKEFASMQVKVEYLDSNDCQLVSQELKYIFKGDFTDCYITQGEDGGNKKDKINSLMLTFSNIIIGGIRGVIFIKTIDHPVLSKYVLPLISPDLLKKKMITNIKEKQE
jgi:hypothetical protein